MGRSRAQKPTLKQKKLITGAGLIASTWLVIKEDDQELRLVSRMSGVTRCIKKSPAQAQGLRK